ncbi:acyl carrier protein [Photobacterium carnosum]|uniref:acyl carrier protein n=1 Tax=Photobacterium carnosum TaxID=2023717 RepID=UPI001E4E61AD|nr:acyl carrier protein [Photobacterium carnosum]MCD9496618.1 hypothetical protein [Photobacterium carnosum]
MKNLILNLKSIIINEFGISEPISNSDSLDNMGLDSIALIEYQYEISKKLNIEESEIKINKNESLTDLTTRLNLIIEEK